MCKYRMYSLVLTSLSTIQKGVQSTHSIIDYASKFHKKSEYIQWYNIDKTIIILNGGNYWDLKESKEFLNSLGIPYTVFYEDDLNHLMTSISFVVDEKVWDTKEYPSFDDEVDETSSDESEASPEWLTKMGGIKNYKLRKFLRSKHLAN